MPPPLVAGSLVPTNAPGALDPSPLWVLPFVLLLLSIAVLPLAAPRFWQRRFALVSFALAVPVIAWLALVDPQRLSHTASEYASFICLLGSLFVISSGIAIEGGFAPTALGNTLVLGLGAVLANLIGTTGASMLLIRPLVRANRERARPAHVFVFFIFIVSNLGGLLTPLGDPPLFLGYLQGVPFTWTLRLLPIWAFSVGTVLGVFLLVDSFVRRNEPGAILPSAPLPQSPPGRAAGLTCKPAAISPSRRQIEVRGRRNIVLLVGVVGLVFLDTPWRETGMVGLALLSFWMTPAAVHETNEFSIGPIREVAILFFGIFATMVPALALLERHGGEFGLNEPLEFFWATGLLSSVLDNAPTYLALLAAARGLGLPAEVAGVPADLLAAISCGAVLMGANTYIGNGPNFMVKAIVEEADIKMPDFFGYMAWSACVLLPVFALVSWLFFA